MDKQKLIQKKFVRIYDTAKRCLLLIDLIYDSIENNVNELSSQNNLETKTNQTCILYLNLFNFIDFTNRFFQMILSIPLLCKTRPEVKRLKNSLSVIRDCRNYLQHMREHLSKEENIDYPILGSFSWIKDNKNYMILPNQNVDEHTTVGIVYDENSCSYICKYQFNIAKYKIHLDTIYKEIKEFWTWFESISHIEPNQIKDYSWGNPNILCTFFEIQ